MALVIIDDLDPDVTYSVGGSAQSVFTIPFEFFADSDIRVEVNGLAKTLTTHFTVTGAGLNIGVGTHQMTLLTAVTNSTVRLYRDVPIERMTSYPTSGPLQIPALNTEQAKHIAIMQQLEERLGNAEDLIEGLEAGLPAPLSATLVDTITSARLLTPTVGATFFVLGHTTRGDGGHGWFQWNATSALADDNGTVILPTGHVGNGRWLRVLTGPLTSPMFGGKVDGATDDTNALVALFAAMQRLGVPAQLYGRQVVREGELIWSANYHVGDIDGPVLRTGTGTTLIFKGVADAPLLSILNNPGGTHVTLTGDTTSGSAVITNVTGLTGGEHCGRDAVLWSWHSGRGQRYHMAAPAHSILTVAGANVATITLSVNATVTAAGVTTMYALSQAFGHVIGGEIGDLTFEDPSVTAISYPAVGNQLFPNRHGLLISGVQGIKFGYMEATKLWGDLCRVYGRVLNHDLTIVNGDPYHVFGCYFFGFATSTGHRGWTLNNDLANQAFGGNIIDSIHNIMGEFGLWRGAGGANICSILSGGTNRGWAVDWSDIPAGWLGGAARNTVLAAELDSPEWGIRIARHTQAIVRGRINHRSGPTENLAIMNGEVWPKIAIQIGDAALATGDLNLNFIHRISSGIVVGTLGTLLDLNNSTNLKRITVRHDIVDTTPAVGPFTIRFPTAFAKLVANSSTTNLGVRVYESDRLVYSRERSGRMIANVAAAGQIADAAAGFGVAASVVPYSVEILDDVVSAAEAPGNYDTTTFKYKCPHRGEYRVNATFALAGLAADAQVRIGIVKNTSTVVTEKYVRANGANIQTYDISNSITFDAGDEVWISAIQPSGAAITVSAGAGVALNNRFEITPLNHEWEGG